jgi:hypothetical protein
MLSLLVATTSSVVASFYREVLRRLRDRFCYLEFLCSHSFWHFLPPFCFESMNWSQQLHFSWVLLVATASSVVASFCREHYHHWLQMSPNQQKQQTCWSWSGNLFPLCLLSYASPGTNLEKAVEWGSHCMVAVCNCQGSIATCGLCTKHVQGRARRGLCLRVFTLELVGCWVWWWWGKCGSRDIGDKPRSKSAKIVRVINWLKQLTSTH